MVNNVKYYSIQSLNSGNFIDIEGVSLNEKARAIQFHDNGQTNQQFKIDNLSNSFIIIKARHSNLLLEVPDEKSSDRTQIIQNSSNNTAN